MGPATADRARQRRTGVGRELVTAAGRRYELPLFLPVYQRNSTLPELPPAVGDQPVRGCIVNAYFLYKQRELRRSLAETAGLRRYLGFDGLVMTDSGAFQAFTRRLYLNNRDITRFQARIGADIVSPLDLITLPGESRTSVEVKVDATYKRVREAQRYVGDALLAGVQQGGRFLEARRRSTDQMLELGVRYLAVGSLVPFFTRRHELSFVARTLQQTRAQVGEDLPIHVYGAGDPLELPFFVSWGADIFDSSSYGHFAQDGWYMTPYGALREPGPVLEAGEYVCRCPVCGGRPPPAALLADVPALATHNLWTILHTVERTAEAVRAGRLPALLEELLDVHRAWFPDSPLPELWERSAG
jgi:7-cyano-7-deazaguanine tRNA-ribosyltransferase